MFLSAAMNAQEEEALTALITTSYPYPGPRLEPLDLNASLNARHARLMALEVSVLSALLTPCRRGELRQILTSPELDRFVSARHAAIISCLRPLLQAAAESNEEQPQCSDLYAMLRSSCGDISGCTSLLTAMKIISRPRPAAAILADLAAHAALRRALATAQFMYQALQDTAGEHYHPPADLPVQLAQVLSEQQTLTQITADAFDRFLVRRREYYAHPEAHALPTGLAQLDAALGGGLPRGELSSIIARPGQGKTQLAASLAASVLGSGSTEPVVFFSRELSADEILERIFLAASPPLTREEFTRPGPDRGCLHQATAFMARLEGGLYLDERDTTTCDELIAAMQSFALFHPRTLFIIDYYQHIIPDPRSATQSRRDQLTLTSQQLRSFIRSHPGCVLLVLAQARRLPSQGHAAFSFPTLDDLAECDQLARDAGLIAAITRTDSGSSVLELLKNRRSGTLGHLQLQLCGCRFCECPHSFAPRPPSAAGAAGRRRRSAAATDGDEHS